MIDKEQIKHLTRQFIEAIGDDPSREGLLETPRRVAEMCDELLNPEHANLRYAEFESNQYGGIILVKNIDFSSICEHHLLPFIGTIHIAYIPGDKIIGISKFARIIDKHSKRLQLQEQLAKDIIDDINNSIKPQGIAIYIEAKHLCMNIRGVTRRGASTITTLFEGRFKDFKMQEMFMDMLSL